VSESGKKDMHKLECVFLVMEFFSTDLKELLNVEEKDPQNSHGFITILYNILCSVNFLHSQNLIHRDIKPSNFLITDQCTVKICDFGLSRGNLIFKKKVKWDLDENTSY
jgi:serine/threonine protein kinase